MQKHGYIETLWDSTSACSNGQTAMVAAFRANNDATTRGTSMRNSPEMREIRKYNEVDVKVLYEIMKYLRANHVR